MRCFLVGSKELAVRVLEELVRQGQAVAGVATRDEEPGMRPWLKELGHRSLARRARELGIPVFEGLDLNSSSTIEILRGMDLDILFSIFWGQILKETVLNLPRLGCFNLHTAYLPRNRGSFPMAWAMIEGQEYAGLTIHKMLPGVDDGPIVARVQVPIGEEDTGASLYDRVTSAGFKLFQETLPGFLNMSYSLAPQVQAESTYHPRGYPYGGKVNPYWDQPLKERFKRALTFPPFPGYTPEPPRFLKGYSGPGLRVMPGLDLDRPRGAFVASGEGSEMAARKLAAIEGISLCLGELRIPRTFFICGQFLESMNCKFGPLRLRQAFLPEDPLVEIADHGYSHSVVKQINSRPDKLPVSPLQVAEEYRTNTRIYKEILGIDLPARGFRTPLGHYRGLLDEHALLDRMARLGVRYVSSDLRDSHDSLHPKLETADGKPRQPYRYANGMLEIPSAGWQDTVFSGTSRTPLFEKPPGSYGEIVDYYRDLFRSARSIALREDRDYFLGLVMHPYDYSFYNSGGRLFYDLNEILHELGGSFCTYQDVFAHYASTG